MQREQYSSHAPVNRNLPRMQTGLLFRMVRPEEDAPQRDYWQKYAWHTLKASDACADLTADYAWPTIYIRSSSHRPVEAACKSTVKVRLGRSGMRWAVPGGQHLLNRPANAKPDQRDSFWQNLIKLPKAA